ncbi:MAG: SDR family NAD(P)-dependent oxidoreductase [Candidatus Acidiferrales bacterium]
MSKSTDSKAAASKTEVCLIAGASRGIGAAIAERLARPGRRLFLNCRSHGPEGSEVCDRISRKGVKAELVAADISDPQSVSQMMGAVGQPTGRLDIFVHCAALPLVPKRVAQLNWEQDVVPQIAVGCRGFLNCLQAGKPLLADGSRIVVLLTDALFHTPPVQMGAYLAAKGALWGLMRAAAKELLPQGIRVNAVSPGMTKTSLLRNYDERALEIIAADHPLERLAEPDEVASVVEMLLSDAGRYMQGANVIVNGGAEF